MKFLLSALFFLTINLFATEVKNFGQMFQNAQVSGELRSLYSSMQNKNTTDTYATAVGGKLKYELAEFKGFSAATAFRTSQDISSLTGDGAKKNTTLSGNTNSYTQLCEAYLNFHYQNLNLRAGRQIIDTPLADSDDLLMVPNTFEAYSLTYSFDALTFMAAHLKNWQGFDAGLNHSWLETGEDGVNLAGLSYSNNSLDASLWYYDISNPSASDILLGVSQVANRSIYLDISKNFSLSDTINLNLAAQYLQQSEQKNSGIEADIYGLLTELSINHLALNIAYNHSSKNSAKQSFSGYGGGALFTSLDNMILDNISLDRKVDVSVLGCSYTLSKLYFYYMYGDYDGSKNSNGIKEHIVEHNLGLDYTPNETLTLSTLLVKDTNKENRLDQNYNFTNLRVQLTYNF